MIHLRAIFSSSIAVFQYSKCCGKVNFCPYIPQNSNVIGRTIIKYFMALIYLLLVSHMNVRKTTPKGRCTYWLIFVVNLCFAFACYVRNLFLRIVTGLYCRFTWLNLQKSCLQFIGNIKRIKYKWYYYSNGAHKKCNTDR